MDILESDDDDAYAPAPAPPPAPPPPTAPAAAPPAPNNDPAFDDIMFRLGAALSPELIECVASWHEHGESFWIEDLRHVYALRGSAACTRARLRTLQAEYYVDRGFITKYIQTEPTEGRQAMEVLLGLDAARSLDDFAARPHELTRPYVDAAADEARREAARASRKRRKKDSWK